VSAKKPGAGVRVSGGRLRVDAARAIDKLRSYQLADPTGWVLEVVRAGVGLEAAAVSVEGSASDVFVAIACEPPPDASLLHLFEELVDPSPDASARPFRLLAIGLNAALGGPTRFADVYAIDASGSRRVRFTPEVFATEGGAHDVAAGLRALTVEAAVLPAFAPRPQRGLVVHVRSKVALAVLSRWATGELPRELALVNDAATEVAIPISVNGLPVPRDPTILLREPLADGGYVAVVTPRGANVRATLEAAELGVVLSREPWQLSFGDADAPVPLVLRIDRPRLPTNAARSAVRWDEPMLERALAEGREALTTLIEKLAVAATTEREPGRRSWLRQAGLMLLAADVRGASYREKLRDGVSPALAPLLGSALLLDATGRARTPESLDDTAPNEVHYASVFARPSLAPWVGELLAAPPGDPTHLLFGDIPPPSAEASVRAAEGALVIRERWLAQPVQPLTVASREGGIVRVALDHRAKAIATTPTIAVGEGRRRKTKSAPAPRAGFAGLSGLAGELVLGAGEAARVVELRLEGRTIERARTTSSVPALGVAEHPLLVPSVTFDSVLDTPARRDVLGAIDQAFVAGSEAIARALSDEPPEAGGAVTWLIDPAAARLDPRASALVREGLITLASTIEAAKELASRLRESPIDAAAAWPTSDGRWTSLGALREETAIGFLAAGARADALPSGRIVLVVTHAERLAITQALPDVRRVDYGRAGSGPLSAATITAGQLGECALGIRLESDDFRGFAGWGVDRSELRLLHVGVSLGSRDAPEAAVPTRVCVDDDRVVPTDVWGVSAIDRKGGSDVYAPARMSTEIARQVVRAWRGARPDTLVGSADLLGGPVVRAVLREARQGLASAEEASALRSIPMFPVFGRASPATLEEIVQRGARIPYVPPRAIPVQERRVVDVFSLELEREEAEGIAALFGLRADAVDSTPLLKAELRTRAREERLTRVRRAPVVDVSVPGAHPVVSMAGMGILEGLLGYAPHVRDGRVRILVEGRPFALLTGDAGLPPYVEGVVSVDESMLDERVEALSDVGRARVRGAALSSARKLLPKALGTRGAALFEDPSFVGLASALVDRKKRKGEPGEMIEALLALPSLASVSGTTVSIADASASGELLFTTEPVEWVGPLEGETRDPLDGIVVVVPWSEEKPARVLLERLVDGKLRDVTLAIRRLVTARRAARGLTPRPPLSRGHERLLARTVEELAERSAHRELILDALGIGAIALSPTRPSFVAFYESGARLHEEEVDFVPAFEAAVESPLVTRTTGTFTVAARKRVKEAMSALLAELLRALADAHAFEGAPGWAVDAQRDAALLGGREHLDQLADVPLFETTLGTRASPAALTAEARRAGAVWWTRDLACTLVPLDEERIVLRLRPEHATALGRYVRLFDADQELALDQMARANRDRPPVVSIAPAGDELTAPLGALSFEEASREYAIIPLLPIDAGESAMSLHRERRLLERTPVPGEIPAIVRVDSALLVPNRLWDGVVRESELARIESTVTRAVERAVLEKLPAVGSSTTAISVDAKLMESVPHPSARVVRGTLWLGPLDPGAAAGVRVVDTETTFDTAPVEPLRSTAPHRAPAALPLEGMLVLWGARRDAALATTLDAVARHVYQRLLSRVAKRIASGHSPDADLDLAHLVRGASLGFLSKSATKEAVSVLVPFGLTDVGTVGDVAALFESKGRVVAIQPEEAMRAKEQRATLARPVFVLDGSLAAMHLQLALGARVQSFSEALAEILVIREEPAETIEAIEAIETIQVAPAEEPAKRPKKTKKAKKDAAAQRPPSRPPPVAPMQAREGPVAPLAVALAAVLKGLGAPTRIVVDPTRADPMIDDEGGALSLAGEDPRLRAIAGTTSGRDRASRLLAAHVLSIQADRADALRALHGLLG
jgi:hypothetical protein